MKHKYLSGAMARNALTFLWSGRRGVARRARRMRGFSWWSKLHMQLSPDAHQGGLEQ